MSILAIVSVIIAVEAYKFYCSENYDFLSIPLFVFGISSFIFIGIVGFGIHATKDYETMVVEQIKPDTVLKSKTTVYIEIDNGNNLIFKDKVDFDEINDSTTFYKIRYYNYYGYEIAVEYSKDKKFKNIEYGKRIKIE